MVDEVFSDLRARKRSDACGRPGPLGGPWGPCVHHVHIVASDRRGTHRRLLQGGGIVEDNVKSWLSPDDTVDNNVSFNSNYDANGRSEKCPLRNFGRRHDLL